MIAYVIRRLLQGLIVLLIVLWFTFTLSYFQKPHGSLAPAYILAGVRQTHACLDGYITQLGLNQSYFVRFWNYVFGVVVHFNLGYSYKQTSVVDCVLSFYIPRTFWFGLVGRMLVVIVALPLGIVQAWKRNSALDYTGTAVAFIMYSIPAFVLGYVLLDILDRKSI